MKSGLFYAGIFFLLSLLGCSSAPTLSPEQRASLGELWSLYLKGDPAWPGRRDAALRDPLAQDFLIQNLIREVIRGSDETASLDISRSPRAQKARRELVQIGDPAIPLLVELFRTKDPAVAAICSRILTSMGDTAVAPLGRALESPEPQIRRWAVSSLAGMAPPRGEESILRLLEDDPEWIVRGVATKELARFRSEKATRGLQAALRDRDSFVRRSAAGSLGKRGEKKAIPALIAYLKFAVQEESPEEIEAGLDALRALSRRKFGPDLGTWEDWWRTQSGR